MNTEQVEYMLQTSYVLTIIHKEYLFLLLFWLRKTKQSIKISTGHKKNNKL
jgi:hypothetical protein